MRSGSGALSTWGTNLAPVKNENRPDLHGLLSNRFVKMSLKTLPLLFINLGGEMVYILDQRLRAQNIPDEKAKKGRLKCLILRLFFCFGGKGSGLNSNNLPTHI